MSRDRTIFKTYFCTIKAFKKTSFNRVWELDYMNKHNVELYSIMPNCFYVLHNSEPAYNLT